MTPSHLFTLLGLLAGAWVSWRIWRHESSPQCPNCGSREIDNFAGESLECLLYGCVWVP